MPRSRSYASDLDIYVVTKTASVFPSGHHFKPIQGGRALAVRAVPGTRGDDTGDNISRLNEYFGELSTMYWVWKNAPPARYVGFFHYRRFLNFGAPLAPQAHWTERNFDNFEPRTVRRFGWSKANILAGLEDCDLALPMRELVADPHPDGSEISLYSQYRIAHLSRDMNLALDVVATAHPSDARLAEQVMAGSRGYMTNICVAAWPVFVDYMAWLFDILERVRARIDLGSPNYAPETGQARVLGFLAERLFNVYIERRRGEGLRIREFERLYGKLPDDWKIEAERRGGPGPPLVSTFHKGVSINALGRQLDVYIPD